MTLYGINAFGILAGLLVIGGGMLAFYGPQFFSLGGWITGVLFIASAFVGRAMVLREEKAG